jgi:hypothetical protein
MLRDNEPKELPFGHNKHALFRVEFYSKFLEVGKCNLQLLASWLPFFDFMMMSLM